MDCRVKNIPCRLTVQFLIHVLQFFHSFNDKGRVRTMSSIEAVCDNKSKFNDYNQKKTTKFDGYNQNVVQKLYADYFHFSILQRSMSGSSELPKNIYG